MKIKNLENKLLGVVKFLERGVLLAVRDRLIVFDYDDVMFAGETMECFVHESQAKQNKKFEKRHPGINLLK